MHDLRDALRVLRATPVVTGIAVLTLTLRSGARTEPMGGLRES
jgi:hypothetical protein